MLIGREHRGETQFGDLEWRDLLHAGRAKYRYRFAVLNLGLQAARGGEDGGPDEIACLSLR
jgi:hypothetical protein